MTSKSALNLAIVFDVLDLEIDQDIDKSAVGCYVTVGKRLLDVLVLNDLE
jgi:hypothetical protein